ncbi:MAG: hypothetical protein AMXMBFR4_10890 [Candidatus Hydrogenedentota bacterium]
MTVRITRRAYSMIPVLMLMAAAASGQQTATDAVKQSIKDTAITARIETLFAVNEHLSPFNINTTTVNGVVTLTGSVADEVQKDLAADLAQTVDGVEKIENKLTVVGTVVSERPTRTWRDQVNDKTLNATIRSRLVYNKELRGLKIGVTCEGGHVTLHGVVPTFYEKDRIEQIVLETRGVEKVTNNLTVHASQKTDPVTKVAQKVSDEWVEKRVATAILLNRHVSIRNLNVRVDNGLCILTGTVDSETQRELAASLASSIAGVDRVQNDIHIYEPPVAALPADAPAPPQETSQTPTQPAE